MEPVEEALHVVRRARIFKQGGNPVDCASVWVVLHGYGQLAPYFLRWFQPICSPKRLVVAPEGLSRFYVQGFSGRVGASWMTKECRAQEIEDYLGYLDQVYDQLPKHTPLYLLGFSQGAATAARWFFSGRRNIEGLVLWCGVFPPDLPKQAELLSKPKPMALVVGKQDPFHTQEVEAEMKKNLASASLLPKVWEFEGGHEVPAQVLNRVVTYMEQQNL